MAFITFISWYAANKTVAVTSTVSFIRSYVAIICYVIKPAARFKTGRPVIKQVNQYYNRSEVLNRVVTYIGISVVLHM